MPAQNRLARYLSEYAAHHRTQGNRISHHIGVPMITLSILGLLAKLQFGPAFLDGWMALDLGLVSLLLATLWYVSMDWRIGIPAGIAGLACYVIGRQIPMPWLIAAFVVGWIIQFIGHSHYERNKPAFFKNFEHLLIGPVWIFGKWFRLLPPAKTKAHS